MLPNPALTLLSIILLSCAAQGQVPATPALKPQPPLVANPIGILYVDDDAPGDPLPGDPLISDPLENGSAAHPFDAIQEALDRARDGSWVLASGVFRGPGNRDLRFHGRAVTLSSPGWNPTACIIDCENAARGAIFLDGEGPDTRLIGVTIRNGYAQDPGPGGIGPVDAGGAIRLEYSDPTFLRCVFENNLAEGNGGAMSVFNSAPYVELCLFYGNVALGSPSNPGGGAVYSDHGDPRFVACRFNSNSAPNWSGGAVQALQSTSFTDCIFLSNTADIGGALQLRGGAHLVEGCTFVGNSAEEEAGAIVLDTTQSVLQSNNFVDNFSLMFRAGAILLYRGDNDVVNCSFSNNSAGTHGGAVQNEGGEFDLVACVFQGNSATEVGGALFVANVDNTTSRIDRCRFEDSTAGERGGAIFHLSTAPSTYVSNSVFVGNSSPEGGVIYVGTGNPALVNCTAYDNSATQGGVVYNSNAALQPRVDNSILWANSPGIFNGAGVLAVTYSAIEGGYAGPGNIATMPDFADAASRDFHLTASSPCIDAGNNNALQPWMTLDLDGAPRRVDVPSTPDTGSGTAPVVDMGAFEAPAP